MMYHLIFEVENFDKFYESSSIGENFQYALLRLRYSGSWKPFRNPQQITF